MKCHQRTIREQTSEPAPPIALVKDNARVQLIDKATAASVILKYEWLGTMPACTNVACGLFFGSWLAGVEVFTQGKAGGNYTFNKRPAICLSRGACVSWAPCWAASYLIRKSLLLLDASKWHYVIAYSDSEAGEIGTVYQACGFVCTGLTENSYWLDPEGKRWDRSLHRNRSRIIKQGVLSVVGHKERKARMEQEGWRLVRKGAARWRYLEALGRGRAYRERRRELQGFAVPYPKRAA